MNIRICFQFFIFLLHLCYCSQLNATNNIKPPPQITQLPEIHLIVDISGSMQHTDPLNLRSKAISMFLYLINLKAMVQIQVFSTDTNILLPLQLVTKLYQDQYRQRTHLITSHGMWTNIENALEKANSDWKGSKRIIILLTDGDVDLGNEFKTGQSKSKLTEGVLNRLRKEGVRVFTVGFSKFADKDLLENLAIKTNGLSYIVKDSKDIDNVLYSIFSAIINPDGTPINQGKDLNRTIKIDKNISDLTLILKKSKLISSLYLINPKGNKKTIEEMSSIGGISSTNFLLINIKKPMVGRWILSGPKQEVERAIILTDVRLVCNFNSGIFFQGELISLECFLTLDGKKIMNPVILDATSIVGRLKNNLNKYYYKFHQSDNSTYNTQLNINYPKGNYELILIATNPFLERQLEYIMDVQDSPLNFTVHDNLLLVKLLRNDLINESTVELLFKSDEKQLNFLIIKKDNNWAIDIYSFCSNPSLLKHSELKFSAKTVSGRPVSLNIGLSSVCTAIGEFTSQISAVAFPLKSKLVSAPMLKTKPKETSSVNYTTLVSYLITLLLVLIALVIWVMYKSISYNKKIERITGQFKFEKKYEHL